MFVARFILTGFSTWSILEKENAGYPRKINVLNPLFIIYALGAAPRR